MGGGGGGAWGIFGDMFQARAGERATETQADTAAAQGNLQNYMYQQSRADAAPYRYIGQQALNQLGQLYGFSPYQGGTDITAGAPFSSRTESHEGDLWSEGLSQGLTPGHRIDFNPDALRGAGGYAGQGGQNVLAGGGGGTPGKPDYSAFYNSPDYAFALQQGQQQLDRSAASKGRLFSGQQMKASQQFGQGQASQQYGNYFNRLASLAGIGQATTQSQNALGANYSGQMSNSLGNYGGAMAAGSLYRGNVIGNAFNNFGYSQGQQSGNNQQWSQPRDENTRTSDSGWSW